MGCTADEMEGHHRLFLITLVSSTSEREEFFFVLSLFCFFYFVDFNTVELLLDVNVLTEIYYTKECYLFAHV